MTRLFRWAFNGAAILSALLFAAACVLWVRSYHHDFGMSDITVWTATGEEVAVDWEPKVPVVGDSEWELNWIAGHVAWRSRVFRLNFRDIPAASMRRNPEDGVGFKIWARPRDSRNVTANAQTIEDVVPAILVSQGWVRGGFGYSRSRSRQVLATDERGSDIEQRAMVPDWFVAIVFLTLPASWVVRRLHSTTRRAAGLCVACGYDLRATPDQCPECGLVPNLEGVA